MMMLCLYYHYLDKAIKEILVGLVRKLDLVLKVERITVQGRIAGLALVEEKIKNLLVALVEEIIPDHLVALVEEKIKNLLVSLVEKKIPDHLVALVEEKIKNLLVSLVEEIIPDHLVALVE